MLKQNYNKKRIALLTFGEELSFFIAKALIFEDSYSLKIFSHNRCENILSNFLDFLEFETIDLFNLNELKKNILNFYPDVIINLASFYSSKFSAKKDNLWILNAKLVDKLCEVARIVDAFIIHFSDDSIFDGAKGYYEEKSIANPRSYYGRIKLATENSLRIGGAAYSILRLPTLIFSYDLKDCFDLFESKLLYENIEWEKSLFSFLFFYDMLFPLLKIINLNKTGIFHFGSDEAISIKQYIDVFLEFDKFSSLIITESNLTNQSFFYNFSLNNLVSKIILNFSSRSLNSIKSELREKLIFKK